MEQIAIRGLDVLPELIRTVINSAMKIKRQQILSAVSIKDSEANRDEIASSHKRFLAMTDSFNFMTVTNEKLSTRCKC